MRKTVATLITAVALAAPFAQAEGTPITASFKYDSALLATESGAKAVLKSIRAQATEACSFTKAITGAMSYDRDCRDDLVEQAVGKIRVAALEDGQATAYVFASVDTEAETVAR